MPIVSCLLLMRVSARARSRERRAVAMKYTDVDYRVFSDASLAVWRGESPYSRATYRYTPLLAHLLVPTVWLPAFGKLLFAALDVLCGWLIWRTIRVHHSDVVARRCAATWLANPLAINVASRCVSLAIRHNLS